MSRDIGRKNGTPDVHFQWIESRTAACRKATRTRLDQSKTASYRYRTGHSFTQSAVINSQSEKIEETVDFAERVIPEDLTSGS